MKKLLFSLILLFVTAQSFALFLETKYRWRNDDGDETTATWKAAESTPINNVIDYNPIRLRFEIINDNLGFGMDGTVPNQLEYSTDSGLNWIIMDNSATQAFSYVASTNVTNGQATTNQLGTSTGGTYAAGITYTGLPGTPTLNLGDQQRTEVEWVIKPTTNIQPAQSYYFKVVILPETVSGLGLYYDPYIYARLKTGCIGVSVASTQNGSGCGPSTVILGATPSPSSTIQWYSTNIGGTPLATGNSFTTPSITATTTYYVSAKLNVAPFCESETRIPVIATVNPIPTVNLGADVTVCADVPVILNAGGTYAYLWDNGTTNITRTVMSPGTYFVTVTGAGNCKKSDTITVNHNPLPIVNLGNDTIVCPGIMVPLDAGNPGSTYTWNDGLTVQTREVSQTGNYDVIVNNEFDCTASDDINITIKSFPLGEINAVKGSPATYTFDVVNAQFATDFQWDFGDGSPMVSGFFHQHTYAGNGIYVVKLTMIGDCDSTSNSYRERTVDVYDASTTGIGNTALKNTILFYPNPATETVMIESKSNDLKIIDIEVFNMLGQKINLDYTTNKLKVNVPVGMLQNGIYSMRINTSNGSLTQKFEIRR